MHHNAALPAAVLLLLLQYLHTEGGKKEGRKAYYSYATEKDKRERERGSHFPSDSGSLLSNSGSLHRPRGAAEGREGQLLVKGGR